MITRIEYEGGGVNGGDRCAKKIVKYTRIRPQIPAREVGGGDRKGVS